MTMLSSVCLPYSERFTTLSMGTIGNEAREQIGDQQEESGKCHEERAGVVHDRPQVRLYLDLGLPV